MVRRITVTPRLRGATGLVIVGAAASVACKPDIVGRASVVDTDRVLAVKSTRAEAKPGPASTVEYSALYVGPNGKPNPGGLEWSFCETAKPLAVTGPIAPACLAPRGKSLVPIASGETVSAAIPEDACRRFGPNPPDPEKGQPPGRPADPDTTGGYYQPVRVLVPTDGEAEYAVGVTRLDCGLAGATLEQSGDYNKRYRPNENPALESLVLTRKSGKTLTLDAASDPADPAAMAAGASVTRGETVTLRAAWRTCPTAPECGDGVCSPGETETDCPDECTEATLKGCTGAEPYVALDPIAHALVDRRETMRVSWFGTDGEYTHERTGRAEDDRRVSSDNTWTAPSETGSVSLWVVVRDDRGGVGFTGYRIDVEP